MAGEISRQIQDTYFEYEAIAPTSCVSADVRLAHSLPWTLIGAGSWDIGNEHEPASATQAIPSCDVCSLQEEYDRDGRLSWTSSSVTEDALRYTLEEYLARHHEDDGFEDGILRCPAHTGLEQSQGCYVGDNIAFDLPQDVGISNRLKCPWLSVSATSSINDLNDSDHEKSTLNCAQCNYHFHGSKGLEQHATTSGHRSYACSYPGCYKTYMQRTSFVRHARTHEKSAQNRCAICTKSFKRKDHMREHLAKTHKAGSNDSHSHLYSMTNKAPRPLTPQEQNVGIGATKNVPTIYVSTPPAKKIQSICARPTLTTHLVENETMYEAMDTGSGEDCEHSETSKYGLLALYEPRHDSPDFE